MESGRKMSRTNVEWKESVADKFRVEGTVSDEENGRVVVREGQLRQKNRTSSL